MRPSRSLRLPLDRKHSISLSYRSARLFMLPQILSRWPGRYVFVISTSNSTQQKTVDLLGSFHLPERVTTIVYTVESSIFPINFLRNLGIRNIETSHFMVLDMDLMLSRNLYSELQRIPNWLKQSRRSAIMIPLFFLNRVKILPYCSLLEDCLPLYAFLPLFPVAIFLSFPRTRVIWPSV